MTNTGSRLTEVKEIDGVPVVRFYDLNAVVSGSEMDRIASLEAELFSVAEQNPLAVVLDFEDKSFIAAAIIEHVFVKLHKQLNAKLKMCSLPKMVMEHFKMNRLATLFHIYTTVEDALAAVKAERSAT
jgi:anti-anti-sigma regulatory factor